MTPPDLPSERSSTENAPENDRTVIVDASASAMRRAADAASATASTSTSTSTPPSVSTQPSDAHSSAHNTLAPGTRLAEFEIVSLIGEGGFGIVYLAFDTSLGRHVALKEYMPSALASRVSATEVRVKSERHEGTFRAGLKSFINEARLLAQFDHASLVKVYRFWEANGTAYMVMPHYKGATLKEALKAMATTRGKPPDEAWLRALLAPLLEALAVLHESHCFHRDVAPDNIILLEGSGRPVLLDFGAARRVIGDMTQALTVILKPGYAPIEQYAEVPSLKQGAFSDQYALAAVVYFAIAGKTPPPAVGRMVADSFQPLSKLAAGRYSERFLRAVDRALAVMPADRPQTAQQFAAELGIVLDLPAGHGGASGKSDDGDGVRPARRRVLAVCAAAVLGIAGAGAVVRYSWPTWFTHSPGSERRAATVMASAPPLAQSTPPPIQPPPVTLPPFTVTGEFARVASLADPTIHLTATLPTPRAIVNRDKLRFTLESNRAGFVYVFVVDPAGQLLLLFPNELDRENRIAAGGKLALPRSSWPMLAGEPLGANQFLAIVAESPRDFPGLDLAHDSVFASVSADAEARAAAARTADSSPFAGVARCGGGSVASAASSATSAPCPAGYGAATFKIDVAGSSK